MFDLQGKGTYTTWQEHHSLPIVTPKVTTQEIPMTPNPNGPRGSQVTVDERHPDWGRFVRQKGQKRFQGDIGGNFFSQKTTVAAEFPQSQLIKGRRDLGTGYDQVSTWFGPIYCTYVSQQTTPTPSPSQGNLSALGTTAIARCKPTNQVAQAANFLAELRSEGLPKLFGATLWESRTGLARSIGEEYLNKEFGWDPMIGDITSVAHNVIHADTVLSQFERGAGRMTRRRYVFPTTKTTSVTAIGTPSDHVCMDGNPVFTDFGMTRGTLYRETITETRVWFSGAFTYHVPFGYNSRIGMVESARHAQVLLGLDITPEVIWNATPWTWAIDWFSNAGDVVSNLSDWATDGLALKYGYIMEHSIKQDRYFRIPRGRITSMCYPSPVIVRSEIKRRQVATPFGFGLTWLGLSLRQLAIATALGLTRR
jgi:hypothetical protein